MEVEEVLQRKLIVDKRIIHGMQKDVRSGIFFSNLVFYFIILTTGTVLFNAGVNDIKTVDQAALALKPLAGRFSYLLFALGVLGTGLLAVPVLAGSLSYMVSEALGWEEGLAAAGESFLKGFGTAAASDVPEALKSGNLPGQIKVVLMREPLGTKKRRPRLRLKKE
jgi:hypothetical protein